MEVVGRALDAVLVHQRLKRRLLCRLFEAAKDIPIFWIPISAKDIPIFIPVVETSRDELPLLSALVPHDPRHVARVRRCEGT